MHNAVLATIYIVCCEVLLVLYIHLTLCTRRRGVLIQQWSYGQRQCSMTSLLQHSNDKIPIIYQPGSGSTNWISSSVVYSIAVFDLLITFLLPFYTLSYLDAFLLSGYPLQVGANPRSKVATILASWGCCAMMLLGYALLLGGLCCYAKQQLVRRSVAKQQTRPPPTTFIEAQSLGCYTKASLKGTTIIVFKVT